MAEFVHGGTNINNVQLKSTGYRKKKNKKNKKKKNKNKKISNNAEIEHSSKGGTSNIGSKNGEGSSKMPSLATESKTLLQRAQNYKNRGNVYFKTRQFDEAIAQYNKAIDICPKEKINDLAIFYQNRAAANEQLKKYSSVKADCTKALELNPRYTKALLRRARVLEQTEDLEAALKDLIIACIRENASNEITLSKIDKIYEKLVKQQIHENLANKKLTLPSKYAIQMHIVSFPEDPVFSRLQHPQNVPQFFKKPLEALKNTEYDDIIPLCTEIIKSTEFDNLPSSKLEVLLLRAAFYVLLGDYVSAIQDFERILNSEDASDDVKIYALIKRANLYMQLEISEIIFKDFDLAISINPFYCDIYYQRGQVTQEYQKADNYLAKAIQKYPENAVFYETRGLLQYRWKGNCDKALEYYNKAIELDDKCEIAYKELGRLEAQRGNGEKAIRLLDKASILCRTYIDLSHIYILKNTAKIQLDIKNELGSIARICWLFPRKSLDIQNAEKPDWPLPAAELETSLQRAQKSNNAGNIYFIMGKQDEAIAQYNKAVEICPKENVENLAIFYQNRATAYEQLKKYSSVKVDCTKALELNPRYTKALLRRARTLEHIGDLDAAMKDMTTVCIHEEFSNHASLLKADDILEKLVTQYSQEQVSKKLIMPSKRVIERYITSFPKDPVFCRLRRPENIPEFFKKPLQALKNTEYDDIIPLCTEIIKSPEFDTLPSTKLEVLLLRATFYLLLGDYGAAIQDFENILNSEVASDDLRINALIKRANLYMHVKDSEMSFKDFELAININPTCSDIYYHRGVVHMFTDNENKAKLDFEKAITYNPNYSNAYIQKCYTDYVIAVSNENVSLVRTAIKAFEKIFIKYPNPPECTYCYVLYAEMMSHIQQYQKADSYLVKAIEKDPEYAATYVKRGLLQLQWHDNVDKAMEYINKAIEFDQKHEQAYTALGSIEVQRGNIEEAIRLFDRAIIYCRTFEELLEINNLRVTAKIEFDIKNQLGHIPCFFRSFSRFIDAQISEELVDCLIS